MVILYLVISSSPWIQWLPQPLNTSVPNKYVSKRQQNLFSNLVQQVLNLNLKACRRGFEEKQHLKVYSEREEVAVENWRIIRENRKHTSSPLPTSQIFSAFVAGAHNVYFCELHPQSHPGQHSLIKCTFI